MRTCRSIAIDLGAESCRVSLGEWDGTRAEVRLVHRFANGAVERGGHLYWDADRRDRLEPGARWLNIPEYLLYRLGGAEPGAAVAEYTNATHTQLVDVRSRNWSDEIFERAGLDRSAAPSMVRPGTKLGALKGV